MSQLRIAQARARDVPEDAIRNPIEWITAAAAKTGLTTVATRYTHLETALAMALHYRLRTAVDCPVGVAQKGLQRGQHLPRGA